MKGGGGIVPGLTPQRLTVTWASCGRMCATYQACDPGPGQLSDCQSLKRMCSFPGLEAYGEQLWKRGPSFTGLASEKLTMEEGVVSPA